MLHAIGRFQSRERPRQARAASMYRRAALVAAEHCRADPREVLSARRRKGEVAAARELAAYLAVVCFNLSRRQVARLTGRNVMLISRFCAAIETARDAAAVDAVIDALETRLTGGSHSAPPLHAEKLTSWAQERATLQVLWRRGDTIEQMAAATGKTSAAVNMIVVNHRDDFPYRRPRSAR